MPMVVGIKCEGDCFCVSRHWESERFNRLELIDFMNKEFGMEFDQILVFSNDDCLDSFDPHAVAEFCALFDRR